MAEVSPRADATTPNVGFTLPTVGLDRDTWGGITNGNWTLADSLISALQTNVANGSSALQSVIDAVHAYIEPIGSIKMWPTSGEPLGWIMCNGVGLSRTDFAELFAVIGTSWGAGDGSTTFNLPDLRGCVPVMFGGWMPFGGRLGETAHRLVWEEMASHMHDISIAQGGAHSHNYAAVRVSGGANVAAGGNYGLQEINSQTDVQGTHSHGATSSAAGNNIAHNNVQPSVGINIIMKCSHIGI